jgi:hypothetical protein
MNKTIMAVIAINFWFIGCVAGTPQGASDTSQVPYSPVATNASKAVGTSELVFDPRTPDILGLPDQRDLPFLAKAKKQEVTKQVTGIIKNKTRYEVSVPSENSDATLIIPAHSWIEYTAWTRKFDVTVYREGKPFYCLKIQAYPKEYSYMCKKYDFMAEIVKPEPSKAGKYKPMKKRKYRAKKRTNC